jgi:hypothetical protein
MPRLIRAFLPVPRADPLARRGFPRRRDPAGRVGSRPRSVGAPPHAAGFGTARTGLTMNAFLTIVTTKDLCVRKDNSMFARKPLPKLVNPSPDCPTRGGAARDPGNR